MFHDCMKQEVRKEPLSRECAVKQSSSSSTVVEQATNRTKTKQRQLIIVRGQHHEGHPQALMVQYGIRPVIANSIAVS